MFDVLIYLYESYIDASACPDSTLLTRKLSAAGFEEDEISAALEWLSDLSRVAHEIDLSAAPRPGSIRIYAQAELNRLDAECRGFLNFLESAGALDGAHRELIIERAMALESVPLTIERLKVIALMVLWQREQPVDALLAAELLHDADSDHPPLAH